MFLGFFDCLRKTGVPVSLREFLVFLEGVAAGLCTYDVDGFYQLGRTTMVKDERWLDRYDRAFQQAFQGLEGISESDVLRALDLPGEWLTKLAERHLTAEERAAVQSLGGFEALMETLKKRLAEQEGRHQGGSKWIGTAGTSPFGAYGYNPEGVRIGQAESRHQRAVKVWDKREFRNLDDNREIGTRTIKLALRALRQWARDGAVRELDLEGTVSATARQGWLDVQTRGERRNAVKMLIFFDVGGSMDPHVKVMEELFSAAKSEFRSLTTYYFHNCLYEGVWRDNARRWDAQVPTWDVLRSHGAETRCLFVGDAAMSPYEITHAGGANEHWNREAGAVWLRRAAEQWPQHLWINPVAEAQWGFTHSTRLIRELMGGRMVPMTLEGLTRGIRMLR
jgi:uncharacterized protein